MLLESCSSCIFVFVVLMQDGYHEQDVTVTEGGASSRATCCPAPASALPASAVFESAAKEGRVQAPVTQILS